MRVLDDDRDAVIELIDRTPHPTGRMIVGIAGPPGSGKSTLAEAVVDSLNKRSGNPEQAALLPMDGFHLDNELLRQKGLLHRKGAPETFDAEGLVELMIAVKTGVGDLRYPLFDRSLDHSLIDAGFLSEGTSIVVVEGNYLLLDKPVWNQLIDLFDSTIFISPSLSTLESRLVTRWLEHGYSTEEAYVKAHGNDLKNAELILYNSLTADLNLIDEVPQTVC